MATTIHPTAVVAAGAEIGDEVQVGPYCVIGGSVRIGAGTELKSHVNIEGPTTIGSGCTIWSFASLGTLTQDLKYKGGKPGVIIGDNTTIREYATINTATFDGDNTVVGNECHLMAYSHVAHDCLVGDGVIMANAATLAGHVVVEDRAIIGGLVGVHQFVRVGMMSIVGGCSKVVKDVPPYMMADGNPLKVPGLNLIGLKRRGLSADAIKQLKSAYKILYKRDLTVSEAAAAMLAELEHTVEIKYLAAFIGKCERGITR